MALQSLPGGDSLIGPSLLASPQTPSAIQCDAANEAAIFIGRIATSDGASHAIDTTGSSSIGWRTASVTFADAGTTLVVGLAAVDTTSGPAPRAVNSSNAVTFDVSGSYTGGGGGVSANSWQETVPSSGSKTIANGDLVALAVQMTARGGSDLVQVGYAATADLLLRPSVTSYTSGLYAGQTGVPNCIITFADGAFGWFEGSDIAKARNTLIWNNGSAPSEYGQLFQLPFPVRACGIYSKIATLASSRNFDAILYSDPLGTPVVQRTASVDANTISNINGFFFRELFSSPYDVAANQSIGVVLKPRTSSSIQAYSKTLNNAAHRIADVWGTSGYGISRSSGAFANINSSLDHVYIGLIISAFDSGGGGSFGVIGS